MPIYKTGSMPGRVQEVFSRRGVEFSSPLRIFCLFFLALAAFTHCGIAFGMNPGEFLKNIAAPESFVRKALLENEPFKTCLENNLGYICGRGSEYPNIVNNFTAKEGVRRELALLVRRNLLKFIFSSIEAGNLRQQETVASAGVCQIEKGFIGLPGIEAISYCRNNWCGAIAALKKQEVEGEVRKIYATPAFIRTYSDLLWENAQRDLAAGQSKKVLETLKELHELKYGNLNAYLVAIEAFLNENQRQDGEKIALELYNDFLEKLNIEQAEKLGDLFVRLELDTEAATCYHRASRLLGQ